MKRWRRGTCTVGAYDWRGVLHAVVASSVEMVQVFVNRKVDGLFCMKRRLSVGLACGSVKRKGKLNSTVRIN